ncbi:MAG: acyltransferase family protein [Actinobacteria bacterium]|nr:acyltransferase family protein [Actinomycetota bacterium]MDA2994669.1 acyltransferase family protein [Actinomycetota bacterium]
MPYTTSAPGAPDRSSLLSYDPSLDGVRALAVTSVALYHAGVGFAGGGFLGVDIFFVLSGYLITTLLVREFVATGLVSVGSFWTRRAIRLLPALLAMVTVVLGVTLVAGQGSISDATRSDAIGTLLYMQNWAEIFRGESYFELFSRPSPFIHTWSLAIEEQWYLLWPVLVAVLVRRDRILLWVTLAAAGLSAMWMVYITTPEDPSRSYYGTDARAQALLIGSIAAIVMSRRQLLISPLTNKIMSAVATVGLLGCLGLVVTATDEQIWMYRGGFTLAALTSVMLIVGIRESPASVTARLIAARPLAHLGRMSYGLYLWHWPVFIAIDALWPTGNGAQLVMTKLVACYVVAVMSFMCVERPMRRRCSARPAAAVALVIAGLVLVVVVLLVVPTESPREEDGRIAAVPTMTSPVVDDANERSDNSQVVQTTDPTAAPALRVPTTSTLTTVAPSTTIPTKNLSLLILGDSIWLELAAWNKERPLMSGWSVSADTRVGCGTLSDDSRDGCDGRLDSWVESVQSDDPSVVLIGLSHWDSYDVEINGENIAYGTQRYEEVLRESWSENVAVAQANGASVVIAGVPCFNLDDDPTGFDLDARVSAERTADLNQAGQAFVESLGGEVSWIDMRELTCPSGTYEPTIDGLELHRDGIHYSDEAKPLVLQWLGQRLDDLFRTPIASASGSVNE